MPESCPRITGGASSAAAQLLWLVDTSERSGFVRVRPWPEPAETAPARTHGGQRARYPSTAPSGSSWGTTRSIFRCSRRTSAWKGRGLRLPGQGRLDRLSGRFRLCNGDQVIHVYCPRHRPVLVGPRPHPQARRPARAPHPGPPPGCLPGSGPCRGHPAVPPQHLQVTAQTLLTRAHAPRLTGTRQGTPLDLTVRQRPARTACHLRLSLPADLRADAVRARPPGQPAAPVAARTYSGQRRCGKHDPAMFMQLNG